MMPGISFGELAQQFIDDLRNAGANVVAISDIHQRPLRCWVRDEAGRHQLEVYLWTVTPGGKGRNRPDERRIQMTGVTSLLLRPGVSTVLGGFSEETGTYAFWDVRRHLGFTPGSPSLQISVHTLHEAHHFGFAAESRVAREGTETAIGVQRDYLLWYVQQYDALYDAAPETTHAASLVDADPETQREFIDAGENAPSQSRRYKLVTALQNLRDARFRPIVLRAYGYRCCITQQALQLVEAAHIVPAAEPTSTDEPCNGLALSPTMHRAYDAGLLGILPRGVVRVNSRFEQRLQQINRAYGIDEFKRVLPNRIHLPASSELCPRDDYLTTGLLLRGWTMTEIQSASA